ncbi:threonyl-tRNA synthetase [Orobanche gracilis]
MASAVLSKTLFACGVRQCVSSCSSSPLLQKSHLYSSMFSKRSFWSWSFSSHLAYKTPRPILRSMSSSAVASEASFSVQSLSTNEPVVSVDWLHANLREPDVKVLDASWYMPNEKRNPLQEYQVAHIPGALFFDVDGIADQTTNCSTCSRVFPGDVFGDHVVSCSDIVGVKNRHNQVLTPFGISISSPEFWRLSR